MKAKRQAKILEIIMNNAVGTQEELLQRLRDSGFAVTQATISRDIRELHLVKASGGDGVYRYTAARRDDGDVSLKFHTLVADLVLNVENAMNLVVVKCLSGMAMSACTAIDSLRRPDIVGTISGDDTFLCITKSEAAAATLAVELKKMLG